MIRPANHHQVRVWKQLCAIHDAAQGKPVGPVHPAQGLPCDRVYASQYMVCRVAAMTEEERQALAEAEQDYAEALEGVEATLRRADEVRVRITGLVGKNGHSRKLE